MSLFDSPTAADKVARSFMMPRTHEELASITAAMKVWARPHPRHDGTRARLHQSRDDGLSRRARRFSAEADPRFGENAVRYLRSICARTICASRTR